jgi:glycosyltransferase involved in cell wall biosynthesis
MQVLLVSPYHGRSSHAAWAEGYRAHSRHQVETLTLSDRAWAWRLRGGAVGLYEALTPRHVNADVIVATSMTDVASLMGLLRRTPLAGKPVILYMHENQLTYPIRKEGLRDRGLSWLQFTSMLAADQVWFNSEHNRASWFLALPEFLQGFPDQHGLEQIPSLVQRCKVVPVGLSLPPTAPLSKTLDGPPILIWNQRWDWDKNPEAFCDLVLRLLPEVDFRVVLLGQRPQREPPDLISLRAILGPRLLHAGWCPRQEYLEWLDRGTLTVSTARHEFFGISVLEAAAHGVSPLLPRKLAYPELFAPEEFPQFFYRNRNELLAKALQALREPGSLLGSMGAMQRAAYAYSWEALAPSYDALLADSAGVRELTT